MDKQQTIYTLSDNRDFIEPFCALVTRELGFGCLAISPQDNIQDNIQASGASLIISDKEYDAKNIPLIVITLPIHINRLLNEIEQCFALGASANSDLVYIGPDLQLSLQNKIVSHKISAGEVVLTDKETQLLHMIAQAGDSGVTREALLKEVWGIDSTLDTHTLETHIYRLRKKLRDSFDMEMIKAFEGGYKL